MAKTKLSYAKLFEKVEVEPELAIPRAFFLHWKEIQPAKKAFISVKAVVGNPLTIQQSCFGHYPMLPVDFPYPVDSFNHPLYLLAQINFSELPSLPGFPSSGWLQFYISGTETASYGLGDRDRQTQSDFRVLYFEESEVVRHQTDFSFLNFNFRDHSLPTFTAHKLQFSLNGGYPAHNDIHYEAFAEKYLLPVAKKYPDFEEELLEEISWEFMTGGHKIGGYGCFVQTDPRYYIKGVSDYDLLFQMDTDEEIMWGDAGVGSFFIHPDDLAKKDFSKVLYNWDCA